MERIIDPKLNKECPDCKESHYMPEGKTKCLPCRVRELKKQKKQQK